MYELELYLNVFRYSFFQYCFIVFRYKDFTCLIILRDLIFLNAIINKIVFSFFFSYCSLLGYKNTVDFCVMSLYLATLLKLFPFNSFHMKILGFSINGITLSDNTGSFTSPFQYRCLLSFFLFNCSG